MAQDPEDHAEAYGLGHDVLADIEEEEGSPMGAHHGEDRTLIPAHANRDGHGPKTMQKIREEFSGRRRGGTH